MNNDLEIKKQIYQTKKGAYTIHEAMFRGEPCYCICHTDRTGSYTILFDHNEKIMDLIAKKSDRTGITCEKKHSGTGFVFKFHRTGREKGISIRLYLWAKYNDLLLEEVRQSNIQLRDTSLSMEGILDMRRCNLYDAGGIRTDGFDIITRYGTEERYILMQIGDRLDIQDYSPELYELLTNRSLCNGYTSSNRGRISAFVQYAHKRDGAVRKNLSRIVLIYNEFFGSYKNMSGAIKRFVHDIPALDEKLGKGIVCGHINAKSYINCAENIMLMGDTTNSEMSTYAQRFSGNYAMRPFAWRSEGDTKILVEWDTGNSLDYFVCDTPEEYADLQKCMAGKCSLTENVKITYTSGETTYKVATPRETMISQHEKNKQPENRAAFLREFWTWCDSRDRVFDLYSNDPKRFHKWSECTKGITLDALPEILSIFGFGVRKPIAMGVSVELVEKK